MAMAPSGSADSREGYTSAAVLNKLRTARVSAERRAESGQSPGREARAGLEAARTSPTSFILYPHESARDLAPVRLPNPTLAIDRGQLFWITIRGNLAA
jgi:hypothetical protein